MRRPRRLDPNLGIFFRRALRRAVRAHQRRAPTVDVIYRAGLSAEAEATIAAATERAFAVLRAARRPATSRRS